MLWRVSQRLLGFLARCSGFIGYSECGRSWASLHNLLVLCDVVESCQCSRVHGSRGDSIVSNLVNLGHTGATCCSVLSSLRVWSLWIATLSCLWSLHFWSDTDRRLKSSLCEAGGLSWSVVRWGIGHRLWPPPSSLFWTAEWIGVATERRSPSHRSVLSTRNHTYILCYFLRWTTEVSGWAAVGLLVKYGPSLSSGLDSVRIACSEAFDLRTAQPRADWFCVCS